MPYELEHRLVVGIASSALFDLTDSDAVFREEGELAYRRYQEEHLDDQLQPGIAFPFVRRLLSLNDLSPADPLVEVIVLSRNDPDTGLRVMQSIASHGLDITRAIFRQGRAAYSFMPALSMSLFLSANEQDVREAIKAGLPAGRVMASSFVDDDKRGLRIAFDFDGVLAGDASERLYQADGIDLYKAHETVNAATALDAGPLRDFLAGINKIQRREEICRAEDPAYEIRLHVSIVTARAAPAHLRAVHSLKSWGVTVNDAFFLGGIDKGKIMEILRPHIFFDDQTTNLQRTADSTPSVHVPFGVTNKEQ